MDYIKIVNERFGERYGNKCLECPYFWFRYNSIHCNINTQKFFTQYKLADLKIENINGTYVGSYKVLEDKVVDYYKTVYMFGYQIRNSYDSKLTTIDDYENMAKEMLKSAIDVAAHVTETDNPQLSIMFDGIGLLYADNLVEAVDKVLSMVDTILKSNA